MNMPPINTLLQPRCLSEIDSGQDDASRAKDSLDGEACIKRPVQANPLVDDARIAVWMPVKVEK